MYEINQRATLASRIIGKGRTGLHKELCTENMKMDIENAKILVREDEVLHIDENIKDIPTMSDGSWNSRGWTASRRIVTAIAENTGPGFRV